MEPSADQPPVNRKVSLIILGAFVFSTVIYVVLCYLIESGQQRSPNFVPRVPTETSRHIIPVVAVLSLLASAAWIKFRTAGRAGDKPRVIGMDEQLMAPSEFQSEFIVALAVSEFCVISGLLLFFMGGPARGIMPYAAGTALVDLVVILPVVLRFWAEWKGGKKKRISHGTKAEYLPSFRETPGIRPSSVLVSKVGYGCVSS
jgi:hypothetical protein